MPRLNMRSPDENLGAFFSGRHFQVIRAMDFYFGTLFKRSSRLDVVVVGVPLGERLTGKLDVVFEINTRHEQSGVRWTRPAFQRVIELPPTAAIMGYTALARWVNADADSLTRVEHNIRVNHNGTPIGKWHLSLKSYRSTLGVNSTQPGGPSSLAGERSIITVTMNDTVFVLLEDPTAPYRADVVSLGLTEPLTHYRNNFFTVRPPGGLENLLLMLKARWIPVRHAAGTNQNTTLVSMGAGTGLGMGPTGGVSTGGGGAGQGKGAAGGATPNNPLAAAELTVEGKVFAIGADWIVRVGLVRSKELLKGMLLEAEYLPLPVLRLVHPDASDSLLSNLLTSILPNVVGANIFAVTISPEQWQDVIWDEEEEKREKERAAAKGQTQKSGDNEEKTNDAPAQLDDGQMDVDKTPAPVAETPLPEDDDDVYVYGVEDTPHVATRDWVGIDRDRRSAYAVIGALRSEYIL